MRKLLIDTASQVFPFLANLIERLVLTAILLRAWQLDGFEYWSLAIAFAGVFILFDAGCQLTFGNGMTEAVVKGDEPRAVAIYRQSNAVFALLGTLATLGVAAVAFSADLQRLLGLDPGRFAPESSQTLFALGASSGLKLCLSNLFAVYRVQRAVARGTALIALAELGRLGALALVVIAGGSLALAAWTNLVLILAGLGAIAMFDISRRWPAFRFAWARPWGGALSGSWLTCLLFLLPTIPAIAVNQVPVLIPRRRILELPYRGTAK